MTHKPEYDHALYLKYLLPTENLRSSVRRARMILKELDFDAIAFRGMSGALIAPSLALSLNKSLLMVRKENDDTHSKNEHNGLVEGDRAARSYIIVDDMISSGETVRAIRTEIAKFAPHIACLGTLEINDMQKDKDIQKLLDVFREPAQTKIITQFLSQLGQGDL